MPLVEHTANSVARLSTIVLPMTYGHRSFVSDLTEGCLNILELNRELFEYVGELIAKGELLKQVTRVVGRAVRRRNCFKTRVFHRRVGGMNEPSEARRTARRGNRTILS